jgi:hypothetical protein
MMGAIYQHDDIAYEFTNQDIETLARALWGECGENAPYDHYAAVAWAMMQRWLRWPGGKGVERWPTFSQFMRAFSQPINPAWARGGAKAKANPEYATEAMLQRREKITNTPWQGIPGPPKLAAILFNNGQLANPVPDAIDFAAQSLVRKKGLEGETIGGNTFISARSDPWKWSAGGVTVDTSNRPVDEKTDVKIARMPVILGVALALMVIGGTQT